MLPPCLFRSVSPTAHREHDFQTILSQAAEDISGGNENVQVTAVNAVDSWPPPLDFWYIGHNVM
eukprot:55429-Eustigmatos_ZCMA.PRE.1